MGFGDEVYIQLDFRGRHQFLAGRGDLIGSLVRIILLNNSLSYCIYQVLVLEKKFCANPNCPPMYEYRTWDIRNTPSLFANFQCIRLPYLGPLTPLMLALQVLHPMKKLHCIFFVLTIFLCTSFTQYMFDCTWQLHLNTVQCTVSNKLNFRHRGNTERSKLAME